ncbi:MAG: alkylmercury lyase [Nitrososphaerales archaeon]
MASQARVNVQIFHVPNCPLVGDVRSLLGRCVSRTGLIAAVEEIEGPYPSPTLVIGGADVTGRPLGPGASCRLDLPNEDEILAALGAAAAQLERRDLGDGGGPCA